MEEQHQKADKNQAKNKFFIDSRADCVYDIGQQAAVGDLLDGRSVCSGLCIVFEKLNRLNVGCNNSRVAGGYCVLGWYRPVEKEVQEYQRYGQQKAFNGHGQYVAEAKPPAFSGSNLQNKQNDYNKQRSNDESHKVAETKVLGKTLQPYECNDTSLVLKQAFAIEKDCAELVEY